MPQVATARAVSNGEVEVVVEARHAVDDDEMHRSERRRAAAAAAAARARRDVALLGDMKRRSDLAKSKLSSCEGKEHLLFRLELAREKKH